MVYKLRYYTKILAIFALLISFSGAGFSQNRSSLEKEKAKIEKEIKQLNKDLASVKNNKKLSTKQLKSLNKKIAEREKLIKNINGQLGIINQEISQTQDSINALHSQIDSMKSEYAKIIQALYKERMYLTKLNMVFDYNSYNQRYLHQKYFREYSRYRKYQAQLIEHKTLELNKVSENLEAKKKEQADFLAQEVANKKQLNKEKNQKEKSIKDYDKKAKDLTAQVSKKQQQAQKLQKQIQKLINEEVRKAQEAKRKAEANAKKNARSSSGNKTATPTATPTREDPLSASFASNRGKLPWPVEKATVLREYGRYRHESGGENINNGLEILSSNGSSVRSVFDGEVSRTSTGPDGQKVMIIRHGDYFSVYTDLATVSVKEGTKVSTKQKIGTLHVNSENKSEFNFQIWKGSESQNPRKWLLAR